ncbi:putative entry exclusion protein TrbK-alt [Henriciella litoralis]|uniref:putative entry exclusion protein TrbK-alt n=1 Tax=Henriciella litoralis TaxID=568102 RepID=UPI0009FC7C90|nr:putative entry exclusion protein TrbK-alt [Henriciella litoralis]
MRSSPDQIIRPVAIALGGLAALFAAVELANTVTPETPSVPPVTNNPLQAELSRCRTVTPEELEIDTTCRAAWAEQRRRFLGLPGDDPEKE